MNNLPTGGDPRLELLRAMRSCHPDWMASGRVTFEGSPSWELWKTDTFLPFLKPHLEASWAACAQRDARTWQEADRSLNGALPLDMAERSRKAGSLLATSFRPPAAEKLWTRQVKEIAEGRQPGHLASVIALRAATFSLSPRVALGCYLLVEARGGWGLDAEIQWWDLVDDCLLAGNGAIPAIRVA
jgi:hypothetical protein